MERSGLSQFILTKLIKMGLELCLDECGPQARPQETFSFQNKGETG